MPGVVPPCWSSRGRRRRLSAEERGARPPPQRPGTRSCPSTRRKRRRWRNLPGSIVALPDDVAVDPAGITWRVSTMPLSYDRETHPIVGPSRRRRRSSLSWSVAAPRGDPGTWFTRALALARRVVNTDPSILRTGAEALWPAGTSAAPSPWGEVVEFTVPVPAGNDPRSGWLVALRQRGVRQQLLLEYRQQGPVRNMVAWLARDPRSSGGPSRQSPSVQFFVTAQGDRGFGRFGGDPAAGTGPVGIAPRAARGRGGAALATGRATLPWPRSSRCHGRERTPPEADGSSPPRPGSSS